MKDPKFVRRGLALVFMTMFLDVLGIAIIMPVLPRYLEELTGADVSTAAIDGGWLILAYAVMQFLFAPLIGNLSDRFGRRPILLISVLTFAIDNLICALATSYAMLFAGRILAGISGASFSTASAYIADVSDDSNRARNFGLIGIAFGTGFVLGPVLGGMLGSFGPRVPFFGAAALSFLNFVLAWFFLPETLHKRNRRRFEWLRANPLGALKQMRGYPGIGWVGLVFFLYWLTQAVYPSIWAFSGAYRYNWSEAQIGFSLGVAGVGSAVVMGLLLPRIVPKVGEIRTCAIGLVFAILGLVGYAIVWEGWMVYGVIAMSALAGLVDPPLRSIAAAKVPASAQGELQGAMTSLSSVTAIIGPLMFTQSFGYFTGPTAPVLLPGAPFALAAIIAALALGVFVWRVKSPSAPTVKLASVD